MSLLQSFIDDQLTTRADVEAVLSDNPDMPVAQMIEQLGIDPDAVLQAKASYYSVPGRRASGQSVNYETLRFIPEDSAQYYQFAPLAVEDEMLVVGMVDPGDTEARNALQFIVAKQNTPFKIAVILHADFMDIMRAYSGLAGDVSSSVKDVEDATLDVTASDTLDSVAKDLGKKKQTADGPIIEDAPVTKMVGVMLRHAVEGRASDIHIEHTGSEVKVRFRVDGVLYTSLRLPKNIHSALIARVKILAKLKLDERRKPQDGRFQANINNRKVDFRVSTLPTFFGEKAVIRILDPEKGVKGLGETGMRPEHIEMIKTAISKPYGLILLTGPTGSGKTTTLYSMIQEIDMDGRNVVSLEDPIEYNIAGMNQSQVFPEIGYTFASGLRSILRQDPDVIMVGEIRDKETAQLAIQAALTGHLVFSTLHTNNAVGVIPRLVDMGVDPYLIAPTLELAIAQRLVKKTCPGAAIPKPIDESIRTMIEQEIKDLSPEQQSAFDLNGNIHEAQATAECPAGIQGRTAVFEMFNVNKEIEHIILTTPTEEALLPALRKQGMMTMKEDAILKTIQGTIPFREVGNV
ncbi:MAG: GspE/PulE family protein [Candidatus Nomurabacteria bacterium]|nr:GspE/PulE family protein [Candidatus Nomurabacteria bacterium]